MAVPPSRLTIPSGLGRASEIAAVFSRDAVLKGSFDRYAESNKKKRGTAEKVEEKPEVRKAGGVGFPLYCPPIPSRQILGGGGGAQSVSSKSTPVFGPSTIVAFNPEVLTLAYRSGSRFFGTNSGRLGL